LGYLMKIQCSDLRNNWWRSLTIIDGENTGSYVCKQYLRNPQKNFFLVSMCGPETLNSWDFLS
jgi:hypothetical protein